MSTTNSRYTYRFLFSYPLASILCHCCRSASSQLITSQWWCWRACFAMRCLIKKMLHPQHQIHHFLDDSSPHLWPFLHLCLDLVWSLYIIVPAGSALRQIVIAHQKQLNLIQNSQKHIDISLFMFFSPVLFIILVPYIDQMQSQLLLTSNQIGWNIDPSSNSIHLLPSDIMTQHLKLGALSWKQTDWFFYLEGLHALRRR